MSIMLSFTLEIFDEISSPILSLRDAPCSHLSKGKVSGT